MLGSNRRGRSRGRCSRRSRPDPSYDVPVTKATRRDLLLEGVDPTRDVRAIATERARLRDPAFPDVEQAGILPAGTFNERVMWGANFDDGRFGWSIFAVTGYEGPAECVEVDRTWVDLWGEGWRIRVFQDMHPRLGPPELWEEERPPSRGPATDLRP